MSIAYALGFVCGLGFVFLLGLLVKKVFFKKKFVYDERQLVEQGKACKYGFYFLLGFTIAVGVIDNVVPLETLRIGMFPIMMGGVVISIIIYAGYCIWKEAYFPINQSSMKFIILLLAIGVLNIVIAATNLGNDMNISITNLMCAVMIISIGLVSLFKLKCSAKEVDEDEDEEYNKGDKEDLQ